MSKATTTTIKASSRMSLKIRDNFYTIEFTEERSVPSNLTDDELQVERDELWRTVNKECDKQADEILDLAGSY